MTTMNGTNKKQAQLPWSHEMDKTLLVHILSKGLHLEDGKPGVNEKWKELNFDLFEDEVFKPYKNIHYHPEKSRKIRDHFISLLESVQSNIDHGNQSGKQGDLSDV